MYQIATWNVNSLKVRLPHVIDWLADNQPDILALQETKTTDDQFPVQEIRDAGYHVIFSGQKTYNGVAILSKSEPLLITDSLPDYDDPQKRVLAVEVDGLALLNVYIPNGSEVDSDKYQYKMAWLENLQQLIATLMEKHRRFVIVGDFNIAPEDCDVHDPEEWQGKVHVSDKEREHFSRMLDLGLSDCYRLFDQAPNSFSWWDYRAAGFRRNRGLRIDHILASDALAEFCSACVVDTLPRSLERPSDHAPVLAAFEF